MADVLTRAEPCDLLEPVGPLLLDEQPSTGDGAGPDLPLRYPVASLGHWLDLSA